MKIQTVYVDTSVISHLEHHDTPDFMQETWRLWDAIKAGRFEMCVSDVTLRELERCPEPKRSKLFEYLATIPAVHLDDTDKIGTLTNQYIDLNVLTEKQRNDCRHIATASIYKCDYIASWNFKHFLKVSIIENVHQVNRALGYHEPMIVSPTKLLELEAIRL